MDYRRRSVLRPCRPGLAVVHRSVPDRVPADDPASFDAALAELANRVRRLAPRLAAAS